MFLSWSLLIVYCRINPIWLSARLLILYFDAWNEVCTFEPKNSSYLVFCESEMTSLGALNCCYSPRWARRVLAFNHPATRVLHIMLKAGPQNLRWEGKISFQEGQVTKLIQSIQWLMCSAIATTWWSSVESSVKRNVWIQQKRKERLVHLSAYSQL